MNALAIIEPLAPAATHFAERIHVAWNKTRDGIFEVGRLLVQAKVALPHGEFTVMVETELPFKRATAIRLMAVAADVRLSNDSHVNHLPTSWGTLYELTTLSDAQFEEALGAEIIRPDMERKDLAPIKAKARQLKNGAASADGGGNITDLLALVSAGRKFGCIYADPPWLYGNQGTRAATSNHYEGLTVAELCALPIGELAGDASHLHLWTTNGFLFECPKIFEAWGFEFKSSFVWIKPQIGIGNYWRNSHEFLLTAVRGDSKRFNDKSLKSWLEVPRGKHSAKPEQARDFIQRASPGPYLELFGRNAADGWTVWGNQFEQSIFNAECAYEPRS